MKTFNPQSVLASSSDEFYDPFSEEARTSPSNRHIQFEPVPCPTDGVHLTPSARRLLNNQAPNFLRLS